MESIDKTLVFENVQNIILNRAFKLNALQDKVNFSIKSKDTCMHRALNKQMHEDMKEFKGLCEMAYACGYDVAWHYNDNKVIVESISALSSHDMLVVHHYYDKEAEGLVRN